MALAFFEFFVSAFPLLWTESDIIIIFATLRSLSPLGKKVMYLGPSQAVPYISKWIMKHTIWMMLHSLSIISVSRVCQVMCLNVISREVTSHCDLGVLVLGGCL
jgi:hypothetical protein